MAVLRADPIRVMSTTLFLVFRYYPYLQVRKFQTKSVQRDRSGNRYGDSHYSRSFSMWAINGKLWSQTSDTLTEPPALHNFGAFDIMQTDSMNRLFCKFFSWLITVAERLSILWGSSSSWFCWWNNSLAACIWRLIILFELFKLCSCILILRFRDDSLT